VYLVWIRELCFRAFSVEEFWIRNMGKDKVSENNFSSSSSKNRNELKRNHSNIRINLDTQYYRKSLSLSSLLSTTSKP
jgi:hypothetical protein